MLTGDHPTAHVHDGELLPLSACLPRWSSTTTGASAQEVDGRLLSGMARAGTRGSAAHAVAVAGGALGRGGPLALALLLLLHQRALVAAGLGRARGVAGL